MCSIYIFSVSWNFLHLISSSSSLTLFIHRTNLFPTSYIMIRIIIAAVTAVTVAASSPVAEYDYVIIGSGPGGGSLA
jgi:hypothetical protein